MLASNRGLMLAAFCALLTVVLGQIKHCTQGANHPGSIHQYSMLDITKTKNISLSDYQGKVVLVVNVATYCGLNPTHYPALNALQAKHGSRGFVVLGFPSNQFYLQEPGTEVEVLHGVKYVRPGGGFVPSFQMFAKIEVNGANESPLYTYLKHYCPPTAEDFDPKYLMYSPITPQDVSWNFETFLVGKDGRVVARAAPVTSPAAWSSLIEEQLALPHQAVGK